MQVSAKAGINIDDLFNNIVRKMRVQQEIMDEKKNKENKKERKKRKRKWYQC